MDYANSIELILRGALNCERFGVNGIISADSITLRPAVSIFFLLGFLYANADLRKKAEIEEFIGRYSFCLEISLRELLSFENSTQVIDGKLIDIGFQNGEDAINNMIEELNNICRNL